MGRKVITMAKELGTESTRYLLHSHDRLATEETVGGVQNPSKSSYGMRPMSMAGNSSPGNTHRTMRTADGRRMGTAGEEANDHRHSYVGHPFQIWKQNFCSAAPH